MHWTGRLRSSVSTKAQTKGVQHFRSGSVRIDRGSKTEVDAVVLDRSSYTVEIRLDQNAVVCICSCRPFSTGEICRHIWAALLAAESQGHLGRVASMWEPYIENGLNGDGFPEDLDEKDTLAGAPPVRRQRMIIPKIESWMKHLESLRQAMPVTDSRDSEPPRRIFYVVDPAECIAEGSLVVRATVSRLQKNGEWGRPTRHENRITSVSHLEEQDRRLLSVLGSDNGKSDIYPSPNSATSRSIISPNALDLLIPMLCETGRFSLEIPNQPASRPLRWDHGSPWLFEVRVQRDDAAKAFALLGVIKRDGEERPLSEPMLLLPGLVFFADHVARLDDGRSFEWIVLLRKTGNLTIPFSGRKDFMLEMARFPLLPPIQFPEELRLEAGTFATPPELKILRPKESWRGSSANLRCEMTFDYGHSKVPEVLKTAALHDEAGDRFVVRDREAEQNAIDRLSSLGLRRGYSYQGISGWELAPARLPGVVRALVAEGWRVEAEGSLYRTAGSFKVDVTSNIDWFELDGQADFEGQKVGLPDLLKALARGDHMVPLGDGSFGLMPEEWLSRYRLVASMGTAHNGSLRFKRSQAGFLDALLATQPEVTFDEGFHRVRQELESFGGIQGQDAPATFAGSLRDYQRDGLAWLRFLRRFGFGGCLADDMGLGKTIQVLALLDSEERTGPALIVVPRSLVFNWMQEAARFAPRLRVLDLSGADRQELRERIRDHDIVLITYGTMRRDVLLLKDIAFDTIILDEAQAIKNASTASAKAARLMSATHRLALTGTPVENNLGDLWSILEFLNPGLLGSAAVFRTHASSSSESPESLPILSRALRPFILRRTKEQVARELPPKTEQTIYCELKPDQRRLYDELRDHYRKSLLGRVQELGIQKSGMQILEALLRLRQAACHPGLIDKKRANESSAKLDALIPQLIEVVAEGHKALVFSQFTSLLALVKQQLDEKKMTYEYLDGQTRDRQERVRRFQEDKDCPLFLVSLKAGGLGLNLTEADYVFLLDPWWNPAVEAQAIDRTHRIGQSRHVFAYRLIARDTVEEKVMELQQSKRDLADAIITADNSLLTGMSRETLELLLS